MPFNIPLCLPPSLCLVQMPETKELSQEHKINIKAMESMRATLPNPSPLKIETKEEKEVDGSRWLDITASVGERVTRATAHIHWFFDIAVTRKGELSEGLKTSRTRWSFRIPFRSIFIEARGISSDGELKHYRVARISGE